VPEVSVVAYFADDPTRTYQLVPWLPVLEVLHQRHPVALVLRDPDSAEVVGARTGLPVLVAPTFADLTELYGELDARVVGTRAEAGAELARVQEVRGEHRNRSGVGGQVVVPDRVLWRPAHGGDEGVLAVVLDAHQGRLAQLAGLVAAGGEDDHRRPRVPQRVGLAAAGALVGLHLVADPLCRAWFVLAFEGHGRQSRTPPRSRRSSSP
jgi:hypothetical protein